ncbi:MAG TPA: DUF2868 domain-containing protein [Casimicrobiaceae bacterium]|nr:DUF2868 domain-containing protein [Casimicrobiaceae bacterium]
MDERSARDVVLVQAIETADRTRAVWSDAERIAVGQEAAHAVGEHAAAEAFLGRRAAFALSRLVAREPRLRSLLGHRVAGPKAAMAATAGAFIVGVAAAHIGPAQRINLLAPPVLALLAWNVAVYALLAIAIATSGGGASGAMPAGLRSLLAQLLGTIPRGWREAGDARPLANAAAMFTADWTRMAAPLWRRRAAGILHVAAAALASGEIAGLYLRGIALEYRAVWQSTFLDASDVARLLHFVLAPGALVTGIAVPGAEALKSLGAASQGENAARWIHLYAGTILVVVVIPRLVLAAVAWMGARRVSRCFPLRVDTPYFQRIVRAWQAGTVQVLAIPYSFDVPAQAAEGLRATLSRAFEAPVALEWVSTVRYGDDAPPMPSTLPAAIIVLFNLAATPEAENHGAIVGELGARAGGAPLIAIVDTTDFTARFHDVPQRIAQRERAWREVLEARGATPLFVPLERPDVATTAASLSELFERHPS